MSMNDSLDLPSNTDDRHVTQSNNKDSGLPEVLVEGQKVERIVEQAVMKAVVHIKKSETFSGPLPKPDHLKAYDDICPGAAQDILNEFKANGQHVRDCEKRALNASIWKVTRGQIIAAALAILCLVFAVICVAYFQANGVAIALVVLTGTLVLPFLGFHPKEKKTDNTVEDVE